MNKQGQPYKILIVDDDKFLLNMYSIKFQKEHFDVSMASNGQEALEKLRGSLIPDAIILDIVMPVMDGLECLQNIRKEELAKSSVIMILSNQGQSSDIQIQAKEIMYLREKLNAILANHTGRSADEIDRDTERDNFMSAEESVKYGMIDKVIANRVEAA